MSIIDKLDEAISNAADSGTAVEFFDLSEDDYAELMEIAAGFDEDALIAMKLDMKNQTYNDYPLRFHRGAGDSAAHVSRERTN